MRLTGPPHGGAGLECAARRPPAQTPGGAHLARDEQLLGDGIVAEYLARVQCLNLASWALVA